jgi:hypothetical protein
MRKYFPLISMILIFPVFSEELINQCSFTPEINYEIISISEKQTGAYQKFSSQKNKLIEIKKQLIEKEKQLIQRNRELVEREKEIERERELLKQERESQLILSGKKEQQLSVQAESQESRNDLQRMSPPQPVLVPKNQGVEKCRSPFRNTHVGVRHTEARGVGYKDGYTTLEGFGIYGEASSWMPFFDMRAHVFDNGKFAGNVGIGMRTYVASIDHLFGGYMYYDVRQRTHGLMPQQVSPGMELLGKRMEYRINAYFPVGDHRGRKYDFKFEEFKGNRIIIKGKQQHNMSGGDAEIGVHLTQSTKCDLYAGAGPYYFTASDRSSWGGKARLLGRYKQWVSLEASYSYDRLFGNVVQGTISLNAPFGSKIKRKGKACNDQVNLALGRAAYSPYRFEIPVVKKITKKAKAVNPATNDPWTVWFVNNTSSSAGTFESPFPTLAQAQNASSPNDMIYVFPGDGTTTGMNMGIVLQNGQDLFGSGISHTIKAKQGKIKIPAFSTTAPNITNATSIVTLGNDNEVAGFNILATQINSLGIDGKSGIQNVNINHNIISGSIDYAGIFVIAGGKLFVKDNQLTGAFSTVNEGIHVQNPMQSGIDVNVSNNTIYGFHDGIRVGPPAPLKATGAVLISNNFISNFSNFGIDYETGMLNSTAQIVDNTVTNNVALSTIGIAVILNTSPNSGTCYITGNTVATTTSGGPNPSYGILAEVGQPIPVSATFIISDNEILTGPTPGSIGLNIRANDMPNSICADVTNNTVQLQASGTFGLSVTAMGSVNFEEASFSNNVFPNISLTGDVNFVESCH